MKSETIGLIGVGLLGSALADRLVKAGWPVVGFDIDAHRLDALRAAGGKTAPSAAEVVARCSRVVISLPTTDVVERVVHQCADALRDGTVLIDTSTGDPEQTAALGVSLAERNVPYLDATISGSSTQVRCGEVTVMAGGDATAFDACTDLFACFARKWYHLGPSGSGSKMKLVTNLVLGLNRAVLAEGLALASRMGLDLATALEVLKNGAAHSRAMDTKGDKMVQREFTAEARLSQHLKDVRLILAAGDRLDAKLPLSTMHRALLERLESAGFGDADNSAILQAFD